MRRPTHYVLSSHWDREWYSTFQHFRYHLVETLDAVLDGLANEHLRGAFFTDGQAIVIEDYLEIRPERKVAVANLAQVGKLVIGPWYNLPDEFCVSGESLIRNLQTGRALVRSLGAQPSQCGFLCDLFGHNSQMPQILAGFGLSAGFLWRGVNTYQTRHLIWEGADGTRLPCFRFGTNGYWGYAVNVRHNVDPYHVPDLEAFQRDLRAYLDSEAAHTELDDLLLFDGDDHYRWDAASYALLWQSDFPDYAIQHTSPDDYMRAMLAQQERIRTQVQGELWEPAKYPLDVDQQFLIGGTLASRVWIKQANKRAEIGLCHWAEPFSAFAAATFQSAYPKGFLAHAWQWLLQNHPHDSICGCSLDRVHEDMRYRFHQSQDISDKLAHEALYKIAASIDGDLNDDQLRLTVFNPLPRPLNQICEITLHIPSTWRMFNRGGGDTRPIYEPLFCLYDQDGQLVPYQVLDVRMNQHDQYRFFGTKATQDRTTHAVTISVPLALPPFGYTSYMVTAADPLHPIRHKLTPSLAVEDATLENAFLKVSIAPNGTLTLTDKRTGQRYARLLCFEDSADIGSGYGYLPPANNAVYSSAATSADVSLVAEGTLQATLRVQSTLRIPQRFDFERMARHPQTAEMSIDSRITLRADADWLEIETTVHNAADDHRLRVLFPSGAQTDSYLCDTPFDVVERSISLHPDHHTYRETEQEGKPQQSWTALYDGQRGLALITDGLLETAVRDLPTRPIALTLFRATAYVIRAERQHGGQMHGTHTFRYWLLPCAAAPNPSRLCELGQRITAALRTAQIRPLDIPIFRQAKLLPPTAAFLTLRGEAVLTSARPVESGMEVRLFNPNGAPTEAHLHLNLPYHRVQIVNLDGEPLADAQHLTDGEHTCTLSAKQIVTLRFME